MDRSGLIMRGGRRIHTPTGLQPPPLTGACAGAATAIRESGHCIEVCARAVYVSGKGAPASK